VSRDSEKPELEPEIEVRVRRLHRRDLNRTWEFLKMVFRDVNRETVEYQRPRSKHRFVDIYDDDDVEQLLFDVEGEIVGYAECAFEISGSDNWLNPRYFDKRGMRPMFVEELAVHPKMQGRGVGGFMLEQLQHLARQRGSTHLVLEVAENNRDALAFYRHRNFQKLDAAIFMAQKIATDPDLLPPRTLKPLDGPSVDSDGPTEGGSGLVAAELPDAAEPAVRTRYRAKVGSRVPKKPKRRKRGPKPAPEE
jgi:ribosomal protein S18 acetylase RimI-like enzyme